MSDQPQPEENITEEFKNLGKSLLSALQTVWDSPERQRIQSELVEGLHEAGATLKKEADEFSLSQTGQQLKKNIEQLGDEIRSAEIKDTLRKDLVNILKTTNAELEKVIGRFSGQTAQTPSADSSEMSTPGGDDNPETSADSDS